MAAGSGITFLASSGDQGSADCTTGTARPSPVLAVNYPASSSWVTGVGGTNFVLNACQPDHRAGRLERHVACSPARPAAAATSDLFNRPNYQKGTVPKHQPRRARRLDALRHPAGLRDLLHGLARLRQLPEHQPVADDRRHERGDAAARRRLRARRSGSCSRTTATTSGSSTRCSTSSRRNRAAAPRVLRRAPRSATTSARTSPATAPLGCCTAGAGFDDASGLGSVNLAAFAQRALARPTAVVGRVAARVGQHPVQPRGC